MNVSAPATHKEASAPPASPNPDVVQIAKALGDQLRANVLRVLAKDSFGVLELCRILRMAQPAVSHHLKKLSAAGLVDKRRESTNIFYQRTLPGPNQLLSAIFEALDNEPLEDKYQRAIDQVHASRVEQSRSFFAHQADALAQQTALICAPDVYVETVLQSIDAHDLKNRRKALEIGPGSGTLLKALAPYFSEVVGLDNSAEMLDKCTASNREPANIRLVKGDFLTITGTPLYNLIVAAMVVHHMPSPPGFFRQAARLLHSTGLLVIAELCSHDQDWVKNLCGDVWFGFNPGELKQWAERAGLKQTRQQFLAQRNGFQVQVSAFAPAAQTDSQTN